MKTAWRVALYHLALTALGAAVGLAAGVVCGIFGAGLQAITADAGENFAFNVWFLPLAGLLTAAVFRIGGGKTGGMAGVFRAARGESNGVPLRAVGIQFAGTWSAHLFCASVGREGAAIQIGAALGSNIGGNLPLRDAGRLMTVAGMAAGFSALFMTPLAAFFFAMEVTFVGKLDGKALLPSLAASFAAYFAAGRLGLEAHTFILPVLPSFRWALLAKTFALGAIFGLAGLFFAFASRALRRFFHVAVKNPFVRVLAAGVMLSCLLYLTGGRYAGLGTDLAEAAFAGENMRAYDWAVKILFTAATLGAGFIGGEVTTMFAAGAALGAVLAEPFGISVQLAVCLGYAAVFGASTGTLLAPVFLGGEVFGFAAAPYLAAACLAAYIFRFGQSVYGQRIFPRALHLPRLRIPRALPLPQRLY